MITDSLRKEGPAVADTQQTDYKHLIFRILAEQYTVQMPRIRW
jgi:hypothetical protein